MVTEFGAPLTAGSRPVEIVTGPDGNLWFTEHIGNQVGRITSCPEPPPAPPEPPAPPLDVTPVVVITPRFTG